MVVVRVRCLGGAAYGSECWRDRTLFARSSCTSSNRRCPSAYHVRTLPRRQLSPGECQELRNLVSGNSVAIPDAFAVWPHPLGLAGRLVSSRTDQPCFTSPTDRH